MPRCDTLIRNVAIFDGSGAEAQAADVAITAGKITALGNLHHHAPTSTLDGQGLALAPGFVDVHTHDDLYLVRSPQMLPKLSQGVTTVIVGNCGISASPVRLKEDLPDPMNLLGGRDAFQYGTFNAYADAVTAAAPAVNVAALVGHTALRSNHLDRLDRSATSAEIAAMRSELREALHHGAIGLSTGLAYASAESASTEEVLALVQLLSGAGAVYTTHLRSEAHAVLEAIEEAFHIGHEAQVPVIVSHLKCAGIDNWGRSSEVLQSFDSAADENHVACDCYPYSASSSTLDLRQVDERVTIRVTWSDPFPEMGGKTLAAIARAWGIAQLEAARRLQPAGAIYHNMSEDDVRAVLRHPKTMIGSDGLPNDPRPHPRLWGTFPRVLGQYSRDERLFPLGEAIRKMTSLPAQRFHLSERGQVREGFWADLVLFNPETIRDTATFNDPTQAAVGIEAVWVNGVLSYEKQAPTGRRAGRFLKRSFASGNK